ncbi:MAG TPA: hypothetical protein DCZ72_06325 [Armatimonadetes bacterium]|nr:hypothetical protein [Armatimonadota bacterium]
MGRVSAVVNQKGGVGKTTTAVSLAGWLALGGRRVLLIDADAQGNASSALGVDRRALEACLYDALVDAQPLTELIRPTGVAGLEIVPATVNLAGAEVDLAQRAPDDVPDWRESRLRAALAPVRDDYDVILIDGPPSLGLLTVNALLAADGVIIPMPAEYLALEGLSQLLHTVQIVQRRLNTRLDLDGVVLTMYDPRTRLAQQVAAEVQTFFGRRLCRTTIPRNVRLGEAPSFGEPIHQFAPTSPGGRAYQALCAELFGGRKEAKR